MNLTFYKNTSDPRKADKTLTSLGEITGCVLRDEENVVDPVFEVATNALPNDFNYCYCDFTGRFYFTGSPVMVRNGLYRIPCHCDILSTAKTKLRALTATVKRNEFTSNAYLLDPEYEAKCYSEYITQQFPNSMDSNSLILITVG